VDSILKSASSQAPAWELAEPPIPVDLVSASASGLDPHISPAAADYQINRVAKARNLKPEVLHTLVEANTQSRQWSFLGEPRVNVLTLNLALDAIATNK